MTSHYAKSAAPRVSVIVPVFNGAAHVGKCLASLLAQTLRGIEIIVVDDGSTDATPFILRDHMRRFANIRMVRQANAGVSVARNVGLAQATGKYIAFADADDTMAPTMYEDLVRLADQRGLDVALCNAWIVEGIQPRGRVFAAQQPAATQSGAAWLVERVAGRDLKHYIWCHLYRREFLSRQQLRFEPGITHQDIIWTNEVMLTAERVAFLDRALYRYRQRAASLSKPANGTARAAAVEHYLRVVQRLDRIAARDGLPARVRAAVRFQVVDEGLGIFHQLRKVDDDARGQLAATLRRAGLVGLLWRNAQTMVQVRRVLLRGTRLHATGLLGSARERFLGSPPLPQLADASSQFGAD